MLRFTQAVRCGRPLTRNRFYSSIPTKSRVQLVAELRKLSNAPIIKARQALDENNGDFDAAVQWLEEDMRKSGAAKAEKVKDRATSEGLISISVLGGGMGSRIRSGSGRVKASIIELNCESDFVSRTEEFARLANNISEIVAHSQTQQEDTSSPFTTLSVEDLLHLSHKSGTVGSLITDLIARIGENISLRRAMLLTSPTSSNTAYRVASYLHQGRVGALDLLSLRPSQSSLFNDDSFIGDLEKLERALAKQTAGFMTLGISEKRNLEDELETVLYEQPFMMLGGENASIPVRKVLDQWQEKWGLEELAVSLFLEPFNCHPPLMKFQLPDAVIHISTRQEFFRIQTNRYFSESSSNRWILSFSVICVKLKCTAHGYLFKKQVSSPVDGEQCHHSK